MVEWANETQASLAYPALRALLSRGQRYRLDPWLELASGYPSAPGSLDAVRLFLEDGIFDTRIVGPLILNWFSFDEGQRVDVLRVLSKMGNQEAVSHIASVAVNLSEKSLVREQAFSSLAFARSVK